jgi:hypothetical protein
VAVALCCTALSLVAIAWSFIHNAQLNYGDAVAHLHIARRVLDSRIPRFTELGSVWLPLPHILMMPFVQVYAWWVSGVAGTIPSALAWLVSCIGFYRLARRWLAPVEAAFALAFLATNPNLLYLQTTAMTEPLFVCEMIWIVDGLVEWRNALAEDDTKRIARFQAVIAIAMIAAIFTRYDGWIMAAIGWTAMGVVLLRRGKLRSPGFWIWSVLVVAAPVAWFVYNSVAYGDWLFFVRGPFSAKAIEMRTFHGSGPPHPGFHDPWVALLFYAKTFEMDTFALWRNFAFALSALGTLTAYFTARQRGFTWALLLWLPLGFYTYSVAYGWVPIFLPVWWPHNFYNTRYGMEMLPALALGLGFAARFAIGAAREFKPRMECWAAAFLFVLVALNAWGLVRRGPLVYIEGTTNSRARAAFDHNIPPTLRTALAGCPNAAILMNTSVYPEIVAFTGIPLRQTINESDLQIFTDALARPAAHAGLVLAFAGDPVDGAVKASPEGLRAIAEFSTPGQPDGTLYRSDSCAASR